MNSPEPTSRGRVTPGEADLHSSFDVYARRREDPVVFGDGAISCGHYGAHISFNLLTSEPVAENAAAG